MRISRVAASCTLVALFTAEMQQGSGSTWPERLSTERDVERAKPTADDIDIWNLPIEAYPSLVKFRRAKVIRLDSREGTFATDKKLKLLASLCFTNLTTITLLNCRSVTDAGVTSLTNITTLRELGLEGTAITDATCDAIATHMRLTSVNVANCAGVTLKGLTALSAWDGLQEITFSADRLTQGQVVGLIAAFKTVKWFEFIDPQHKLDWRLIKSYGEGKKIRVVPQLIGGLQGKYGVGK